MKFKIGQAYTRDEIHEGVGGGGKQAFLPNRHGVILAGCFRTDANPGAPDILLPGMGPEIIRSAEIFSKQPEPVPVFIKKQVNSWEYRGSYRVKKSSRSADEVATHSKQAMRVGDVSMVLFLERVH